MIYLSKEEVIHYNKTLIFLFGGIYFQESDNISNRNSFGFMLEAPRLELFGVRLYSNIFIQGATYLFYIIKDHIFHDGNKRTGMMAAFLFLEKNGVRITKQMNQKRIVRYTEKIADCKPTIENISRWLRSISTLPTRIP